MLLPGFPVFPLFLFFLTAIGNSIVVAALADLILPARALEDTVLGALSDGKKNIE